MLTSHPRRTVRLAILAAALGLVLAVPAQAQVCAEPSALDLAPSAEPLRVAKAGVSLSLTWEDVGSPAYEVMQGTIDSLFMASRYDHVSAARGSTPMALLPVPAANSYVIARSDCGDPANPDSLGRDSFGRERPDGPLAVVTVAVVGGINVFAVQVALQHPAATTVASLRDSAFIGPFAPAAPGTPTGAMNAGMPDLVRAVAIFTALAPPPAFDPPPASPGVDVASLAFRFTGALPTPADFALTECFARDEWGIDVPGLACEIAGVTLR